MAVAKTNLEAKFVRRALEKDDGKSGARERGGRARESLPSALIEFPSTQFPSFLSNACQAGYRHSELTRPSPLRKAHGENKGFLFPITPCALPGQSSTEITGEELASETRVGGYYKDTIRA